MHLTIENVLVDESVTESENAKPSVIHKIANQSDYSDSDDDFGIARKISKPKRTFVDSSDEENLQPYKNDPLRAENKDSSLGNCGQGFKVFDSDSGEESNGPIKDEAALKNSNDLHNSTAINDHVSSYKSMFDNKDLYDADGSSDDEVPDIPEAPLVQTETSKAKPNRKKSLPSKKSSALEEIHSESQRLVRQSRLCLPYHQPKQRSLSEFLTRRKVPLVPLRTTSEQLSHVWQCIEEGEKTAELFYKSSDSEDSVCDSKLDSENLPKEASLNKDLKHLDSNGPISDSNVKHSDLPLPTEVTLSSPSDFKIDVSHDDAKPMCEKASHLSSYLENVSKPSEIKVDNDILTKDSQGFNFSESESLKLSLTENTLFELSTFKPGEDKTADTCNPQEETSQDLSNHDKSDSGNTESIIPESKTKDSSPSTEEEIPQVKKTENNPTSTEEEIPQLRKTENNPPSTEEEIAQLKSTPSDKLDPQRKLKSLLHNSLIDVKLDISPKMSGSPDSFIDLEEGSTKPGAYQLVSRFIKHVKLKPRHKNREETLSVSLAEMSPSGEVIALTEEVLRLPGGTPAEESSSVKPGQGRSQLKAALRERMAQKREEEFVRRVNEYRMSEEIFDDGDEEPGDGVEELDEDFEIPDSSATSESEPEEEDLPLKENYKKRTSDNPFLDREAEESSDQDGEEGEADEAVGRDAAAGSDSEDVYSDPPSLNVVAPLLDDKTSMSGNPSQVALELDGLSGLCSGVFPTQGIDLEELEKNDRKVLLESDDDITEKMELNLPDEGILDTASCSGKKNVELDEDSSDEEIFKKKGKKKAKLNFSDEEEDEPKGEDPEEEELQPEDVQESEESQELDEGGELQPEDEEDEEAFLTDPTSGAKRFLEEEAELSGSEYAGSGDEEDGLDLDNYEEEQGDQELFNQRKLQAQLEKIHMKSVLDEDKREIRILQELLLEDGELHSDGPKRQRLFKWYNQDENDLNHTYLNMDDEGETKEDGGEEEEDESWRKTRLERENFLKDLQMVHYEHESDLSSPSMPIKLANKSATPKESTSKTSIVNFTSPNPRKKFTLVSKRGSFLNRGEKILSKIAEITNFTGETSLGNTKGNRNMVFSVVTPPKDKENSEQTGKRKNSDDSPAAVKKLKFNPVKKKSHRSVFEKLED